MQTDVEKNCAKNIPRIHTHEQLKQWPRYQSNELMFVLFMHIKEDLKKAPVSDISISKLTRQECQLETEKVSERRYFQQRSHLNPDAKSSENAIDFTKTVEA